MKKYILPVISILTIGMFLAVPVFAQDYPYGTIPDLKVGDVIGESGLFMKILNWTFNIIIILGLIYILFAGYRYMTSGGDSAKVQAALQNLIYALIGIAIAILARALVNFVVGWVSTGTFQI
ncbi:MAG: hypothetical protein PHT66_01605 [Candidatus Pacebacteria bacterium]|jgi:hypothetical protein|nr:hypothetical protein [Candidatus Paceibacterota bacterium]